MNDDTQNKSIDNKDEAQSSSTAVEITEEKIEEQDSSVSEQPVQDTEESTDQVDEPVKKEDTQEETQVKEESLEPAEKTSEKPVKEEKPSKAKSASDNAKWYIVHTYSGHENKVAKSLHQRVESMGFENRIFDIIVPTRDTVKVSQGKKENVKEKIFPGYVLVKMILDDESWLLVRTTQGVTAFIGAGNNPTPISAKEAEAIQKFK